MKKFLAVLFVLLIGLAQCRAVTLKEDTIVTVRTTSEIDADKVKVGEVLTFQTVEDIVNDNKIIFPQGTNVYAKVVRKRNNFIFGVPGEIFVGNFEIIANDGTKIPLEGHAANLGTARYWTIIPAALFLPLLFVKGNDGKIAPNTFYTLRSY